MKKITLLAAVAAFTAFGEMRELTFQVAVPANPAPKIDGELIDECWKKAPVHSDYYEYLAANPRRVTNTKTDCLIVYDDKGVYTGIRNWEDHPEKLVQKTTKNFQDNIWWDDCGEIFYDPDAAGIGFYKFIVNSLGKYDTAWRMDTANMDEGWTCEGVLCAAKVFKDRWEVELFIPWEAFHGRPGPKPGDIWTFNHSRFRFGALGWGRGFSTSAPGGSGVSANKFGYLYFSDGKKPDAKKVLAILEKRLNCDWGILIDGAVYIHDYKGTQTCDLDADQKNVAAEFDNCAAAVKRRIDELKSRPLLDKYAKIYESYTNETARYDHSFAAVKTFREILGRMRDIEYEIRILDLVKGSGDASKMAMPLAGRYDLEPPREFDGLNGWFRHNTIRNAYVTPHLDWCKRLPGGAPKVLFMTGFNGSWRDMIELDERNELDPMYFPGNFGATGIYEDPLSHGGFLDKQAQFETLMAKNPKVVVLNCFGWGKIPARYRYEILRRVRDEGMGLAMLWGAGELPRELTAAMQVDGAARSALARRVPYAKLPGAGQPWRLPKGVTPTEGLTFCWRLGKGRVVRCDMRNPGGWSLKWKAGYESRGAYQMNAIRWAAGEDPATDVVFASGEERDDFCFAAPFLAFEVDTKDSGFNRVRCRLRTAENKVLKDEWKPLDAGRNLLSVDLRDVAAGEYYLDVIPAEKGFFSDAKSDFAAVHPFSRESTVGRFVIASTNITVIAEGSRPTLPVDWEAPLESDGKLLWEIYDTYKQLLIKGETPVKKGARGARFQFDAANFPTLSGFVQATLKDDAGVSIVEGRKTVFFPNHRFADYTMIIWESMYEQGMTELFAPTCVGELGYDNHLGESGWLSAAFNARAVPYITRVCLGGGREGTAWSGIPFPSGTNKEHKAQLEALKKDVNCYRPEIRRLFEEGFTPRVKKCAPYGVCVYNLGDECWYSDDIGFGDATDDGFFFDWLKKRYGTVERYNAAHGTSIKAFNEVRRMTTGEARKAGDWPAYFDQASYAAKMYSDTFQMCRAVIKKYDPKGRVGAEGSPAGNIDETVKNLEFWGPYGNFAMDEVLRSIAPDCVRGMWWGGYLRDPRDGFPGHQWEYLLTGRANGDQWFAGMSGSTEGAIAGDYTLAPFVRKMHKHHSQLKHGLASFMIRTPLRRDPFVIYYSWASCCAAPLSDEFTSPMIGCGNLVQFCYRRGLESSFVTPGSLKNLEGRRLVFLPSVCSLSDEEAAALKAFVKKGGKIYADSEPGVLDGFLARRKTPPLQGMWTKYGAKASDEELLAIVGTAGAKQTEFVEGLEWSRTVLRTRVLGDMKCVGFTCRTKNIGRKVTLGFGREGYIYEVDSGYVGTGDKVTVESLEKPFKLYAQFTAEQKLPEYPADRCEIAAGEKVNFETKALRKGSVYRLTVSDPEGKAIKCRERLICADPVKEPKIEVQFPYNDRAGGYSVSLTDIATGLTGVSKINVK